MCVHLKLLSQWVWMMNLLLSPLSLICSNKHANTACGPVSRLPVELKRPLFPVQWLGRIPNADHLACWILNSFVCRNLVPVHMCVCVCPDSPNVFYQPSKLVSLNPEQQGREEKGFWLKMGPNPDCFLANLTCPWPCVCVCICMCVSFRSSTDPQG